MRPDARSYHARSYHEGRAEEELELAQHSSNPAAVKAHHLLAELHLSCMDPANDAPAEADLIEADLIEAEQASG